MTRRVAIRCRMRRKWFTEGQIVAILKEGEAGTPVAEICRQHGISQPTYHRWKAKCGGMDISDAERLKELESRLASERLYGSLQ